MAAPFVTYKRDNFLNTDGTDVAFAPALLSRGWCRLQFSVPFPMRLICGVTDLHRSWRVGFCILDDESENCTVVPRFWQYEDAATSFGEVTVDPQDLGRMLLIDFALAGADDWHVIPLPLQVGAVATVAQLHVIDTFGQTTDVAPVDDGTADNATGTGGGTSSAPATGNSAANSHWRMFRISTGDDDALPLALIAPTPGAEQLSSPIEDLRLTRDEEADLGWVITTTVTGARGDGLPVDPGPIPGDPQPVAPAVRAYVVQTPVPAGWTPLVPQSTAAGGLQLARGTLAADPTASPPGTLAKEITAIREEILPTEGLSVLRRWHYARWIDGSVHAWIGREVSIGAGEPDSKLAFDRLV